MMPSAFGQCLGMQKDRRGRLKGPRALVIAGGQAAVLDWPLTPRVSLREPVVDALWIQPGYRPPAWGKNPPSVAPEIAGLLPKSEDLKGPRNEKKVGVTVKSSPNTNIVPGATHPTQNVGAEKSDPFGDLVAGALVDAIVPGASVIMDIANAAGEATTSSAPNHSPLIPGIPETGDAEPQEPEPEVGE